jgi:D-alanyl-D-alanine carboxypeptidase (penicillin-binding protein 5/6)
MNNRAKELGMNDTNFVNCCGLDADGHVSSAYDVALMSRELMGRFPEIQKYTTTWMDSMTHVTKNGATEFGLSNTNKLIRQYEGITGLKTGSTSRAMYCLSATATRNNVDMISVILAAPDTKTRFKEAANLLSYGFSRCKLYTDTHEDMEPVVVDVEKSMQKEVRLVPKEPFHYVVIGDKSTEGITEEILLYESIVAPVGKGEELGAIIYMIEAEEIGRIPLVSEEEIVKSNYMDYIKELLKLLT